MAEAQGPPAAAVGALTSTSGARAFTAACCFPQQVWGEDGRQPPRTPGSSAAGDGPKSDRTARDGCWVDGIFSDFNGASPPDAVAKRAR